MEDTHDLNKQRIRHVADDISRKRDDIFRETLEKHFGEASEDNARKCTLVNVQGIMRLEHDGKILCEIYPPEQESFIGSSATNQITFNTTYRIF